MDVNELAPALLSVGDLLREVNRQLNGDATELRVKVKADFKRGSFELALILDQNLLEQAKNLLFPSSLSDAKMLLEIVFGTGIVAKGAVGITNSLLDLWKKFKGKKPERILEDSSKNITIIQMGDNNQAVGDSKTAFLYNNDKIRHSIAGAVRPLARPGIKKLEVKKGKKVIVEIDKSDLPAVSEEGESFNNPGSDLGSVQPDTREAVLRVTRANFEKGKWGFSDGTADFSADIQDPDFKEKLDAREIGFLKGDILRVILQVTQVVSGDQLISSKYVIVQVIRKHHMNPTIPGTECGT